MPGPDVSGLGRASSSPVSPAPHGRDVSGWLRADALCDPMVWRRLARAYSDGLDTPHLPVGGACGLQHYAGRFALASLGVWVQTGRVLPMDRERWWLRLNEHGHTTAVVVPEPADGIGLRSVADLAEAMLTVHLRPVVDAVRAATRITDRVAFGCLAASCAGAFGALHRRCGTREREWLHRLAEQFLGRPDWPTGTPLVRLTELELDAGTALVHERYVCCLIRLGKDHDVCATCPELTADERAEHLLARASAAEQATDLPVVVWYADR